MNTNFIIFMISKKTAMILTDNFRQALMDYILLMNKDYPHKTILELVATRYSLNHFERSMLYRGISPSVLAAKRSQRLADKSKIQGKVLHIDLFNALYTVAAYLRGFPVYLSNDGFLRDASESHGSGEWEAHLDRALDLLIKCLAGLKIKKAVVYIDDPLEHGQFISEKLAEIAKIFKPEIEIISDQSPDHLIREAKNGIIATSDSTIIDKSALPAFDLPRAVLEFHFEPKLLRLDDFQNRENR